MCEVRTLGRSVGARSLPPRRLRRSRMTLRLCHCKPSSQIATFSAGASVSFSFLYGVTASLQRPAHHEAMRRSSKTHGLVCWATGPRSQKQLPRCSFCSIMEFVVWVAVDLVAMDASMVMLCGITDLLGQTDRVSDVGVVSSTFVLIGTIFDGAGASVSPFDSCLDKTVHKLDSSF